jgi:hypothetical protein
VTVRYQRGAALDDELKSYLADQSAANSSSEEDDPQSRDDPNPTDEYDDEELPEDDESPGDDAEDEDDEEEESSEQPASAGYDPRLAEIEARAAAAEQRALQLENQMAIDREYARLQARWAQMDPEDADAERTEMVNHLANQQVQAVKTENLTLRQTLAQIEDLREHKPKAIAFLAEKHALNLAERKQLERINDPIIMASTAEMFAEARKDQRREARRAAKEARLRGGNDRIGSSTSGAPAGPPPESSGNPQLDYLRQQSALVRR